MSDELAAAVLPDDDLEQAQALIGMPIRVELWNHEATRDTIRHYAYGIGDDNPLFSDPDYAAGTRWGTQIAPPTFFFGVFDAVVAPGLPDVQWFYAGSDWTFERPARRGDEFTVEAEYSDVRRVGGDKVGRMLLQTGTVRYLVKGELVATVRSHCFRVPRRNADGGLRYEAREAHVYSRAELDEIRQAMLTEYRRGAETLYHEDVAVGDRLPGTVRGPLALMDMTTYYAGAVGTSGYKSTKLRAKYNHWARHNPELLPNNYDPSYYGAGTVPSIGHQDPKVAVAEVGMPGAYDNGPQRIGMLSTAVTNWMGDDGQMRQYNSRLHLPMIFGDTLTTHGKVIAKRIESGRALVDLALHGTNQLGQKTISATATVELPQRG